MNDQNKVAEIAVKVGKMGVEMVEAQKLQAECFQLLNRYERETAIQQEQKVIDRYEEEIRFAGLFTNVHLVKNMDNALRRDVDIMCELLYLADRIPVYECLKQGNKELASRALEWVARAEKNDTRD